MIKRFVILRKRPDLTKEEFWDYWENVHGKLIAKLPGLLKYIQYHVESELSDAADIAIDGIAELWFENEEAQKQSYQSPEYAAVLADELNLFTMNSKYVHPVMTRNMVVIKDDSPKQ